MRSLGVSADYAADRSCRATAFGGREKLKLPFQLPSRSSASGKRIVLRLDYGCTDECRPEHRKADRLVIGCRADIRSDGGGLVVESDAKPPKPKRQLLHLFVLFLKKCIFVVILLVCASVTGCRYSDSLQADSRFLIGRYTPGSHFYRPTRAWHKKPVHPEGCTGRNRL